MANRIRTAFETALDWIAPSIAQERIEEPPQPPPQRHLDEDREKTFRDLSPAEKDARLRELAKVYHRGELDQGREREPDTLYARYQRDRQQAWQERQGALEAHRARWAEYDAELREWDAGVRAAINEGRGREKQVAHLRQRNQREQAWIDRRALEREQRQAIEAQHPLAGSWDTWLEREAGRGDRAAQRALAKRRERLAAEQARDRDRDDDGRELER